MNKIIKDINGKKYNVEEGFWYGSSARPVFGLFIKDIKRIVALTDRKSHKHPYYDMVETNSRMSDKGVYDYELTPLSETSWLAVDIKDLKSGFGNSDNAEYLLNMPISEIQKSVYYFVKSENQFANAITIPKEQVEALTNHLLQIARKSTKANNKTP